MPTDTSVPRIQPIHAPSGPWLPAPVEPGRWLVRTGDGSVVPGMWDGETFTEDWSGLVCQPGDYAPEGFAEEWQRERTGGDEEKKP